MNNQNNKDNKITRRNFLLGTALLGASATSLGQNILNNNIKPNYKEIKTLQDFQQATQNIPYYPPSLLGLRGDSQGVQAHAHSAALRNKSYFLVHDFSEEYDLIVVGAGVSGLAAAYRFKKERPDSKILILDNHEDFGGHAVRNEFTVNNQLLISYGGSESIDNPKNDYSKEAKSLLRDLGVDYMKFHQYFQQDLYTKKWGLKTGIYFDKDTFGESKMVLMPFNVGEQTKQNKRKKAELIQQFPMSPADKKLLTELYNYPKNYLKINPKYAHLAQPKNKEKLQEWAESTSYYDFLKNLVGLSEIGLKYLNNISLDYWGHAINAISVQDALENDYAGVQNLGLESEGLEEEPYIYHFPDGNASIARLIVRQLIPTIDPKNGHTMEDIVTAKFDYSQLDSPNNLVRIRLNSTVLRIENINNNLVGVSYAKKGEQELKHIRAKKVIYAGHAALTPHIISEMPEHQIQAMKSCVKIPIVYGKVVVKNSMAFKKLGVYDMYLPNLPYCTIQLEYPVKIGDYTPAQTPEEPMILHCVRIATAFDGKDGREMYRNGRRYLMGQQLPDLEKELFDILRKIYALAGENFDDMYVASAFHRWAHGYAYEQNILFDSDEVTEETTKTMQKPIGNIFMANSDVAWMPYLNNAIDEGYRAAKEALKS